MQLTILEYSYIMLHVDPDGSKAHEFKLLKITTEERT